MQWYYERDGQQVGPVSHSEMVRLIVHRHIRPQTLVWHPGFGNEWRPASKAGLVSPSAGVRILISTEKPLPSDEAKKEGHVSSVWAWLMLVPGLIDLLLLVVGQQTHWAVTPGRPITSLCVSAILFLTLVKDRQTLARAGVRPPSFWWWLFLPGYFWCRRKVLHRGGGLFAAYIFLNLLQAAVLFSNPPPGFNLFLKQKQVEQPAASAPHKAQPGQDVHHDAGTDDTAPSQDGQEQL